MTNLATPSGFRDVLADEALAREGITREVAQLFASEGYAPIETPTLEAMDLLAGTHVAGSPFRFFDSQGDLLAMRPDVTLQVARMCATRYGDDPRPLRFRYTQRVFREAEGQVQATARELTQVGVECIGDAGPSADAEVVSLLARALALAGVEAPFIALATVSVLNDLLEGSGASAPWRSAVRGALHRSDFVELDRLCGAEPARSAGCAEPYAAAIRRLPRIRGGSDAIHEARELADPLGCASGLDGFAEAFEALEAQGLEAQLLVDFSVMSSFDYYTGIVFEAYAAGCGSPLGSGGRYDGLIGSLGSPRPAAGFAFYLESAMQAAEAATADGQGQRPLRIAVPKGSLNHDAIALLDACGLDVAGLDDPGRQLVISNPGVDYIIVRPSDAPAFVALGAADCGICGKDSLAETAADVVEMADLRFGACSFVVAEPEGAADAIAQRRAKLGSIRVATKYPRVTRAYYSRQGQQVDIVTLHGNIELAPLTGLAERIVDITATGTTLRENRLRVVDEVMSSTARFFANPCSFRTDPRVMGLARAMVAQAEARDFEPIAGAT